MSVYYPQAAIILRVVFESFDGQQQKTATLEANPFKLHKLPIIARNVTVHVNDYTQADTFSAEIDYKQFPFDPRTIRNCGVTIMMGDQEKLFKSNNATNTIVPSEDNTVFEGFVDEETVTFDDEKRTVRLEGRDFTGLFLDAKWSGKKISTTTPLDTLIRGFISELESVSKIKVDNRTGHAMPTIAQFAPDFDPLSTTQNTKPGHSYWDVIQELVSKAALVAYIELDTLVITKPQVLYDEKAAKMLIYGQNVKHLEFKRKLGRKKGFNIAVISFDLAKKEAVQAKIPEDAEDDWLKHMGLVDQEITIPQIASDGSAATATPAPYMTFRFSNITEEQAIQKGQSIFEEVGRQQLEGSLVTHEMQLHQKDGVCFEAADIHIGAAIKISIEQDDLDKISHFKSESQRERYLRDRCYAPAVAKALAHTLGRFSLTFYTKSAELTMNQDTGFTLKINFINFIQIENKDKDDE